MKKLLISALILLLSGTPSALAQVNVITSIVALRPTIEVVSPNQELTFDIGDTIDITAHVDDATRPVYAYLIEVTRNQRIWIDRVPFVQGQTSYKLSFDISDDFFESNRLPEDLSDFRIGLTTRNGVNFARALSRNRIHINPPADLTISQPEVNNETDETPEPAEPVISEPTNTVSGLREVATYHFFGSFEPWIIRKITIVNDTQDDGFDYDTNEASPLVKRVIARYKNSNGDIEEKSGNFAVGRGIISNMDFWVPRQEDATLTILADIARPSDVNSNLSGSVLRLGIQDKNNSGATFDAIGAISNNRDTTLSSTTITSGNIDPFIVHDNIMTFQNVGDVSRPHVSGEATVYEFTVSANAGSVAMGRLVFDITAFGLTTVDQVSFWRDNQKLQAGDAVDKGEVYLTWDAGATSCFAQTTQASGGGMNCAGGTQSKSQLIVAFNQEEIIPGGQQKTYKITMNSLRSGSSATLAARLRDGDENKNANLDGNGDTTGFIYNGGAGNELFTNATDFHSEASTLDARNVIWSDRSANLHRYPTTTAGNPPTINSGSSADWTNGYLLGITGLSTMLLTK